MTAGLKLLVSTLFLLLLGIKMTSAATVTNCSSLSNNSTCEQKCDESQQTPCNAMRCEASSQFEVCKQDYSNTSCNTVHCQDAQKCTQTCLTGKCDRLTCANISTRCLQLCWDCDQLSCTNTQNCNQKTRLKKSSQLSCTNVSSGCIQECRSGCDQLSCTNSPSCSQRCSLAPCSQLRCTNSTECTQDCDKYPCEEMRCDADVETCQQSGANLMSCSAETCRQWCPEGNLFCKGTSCKQECLGGHCNMSCSAGVKECDQYCTGTCLVHCESASCRLYCGGGTCTKASLSCEDGHCKFVPDKASSKPTSASVPLATVPSSAWLACLLLFNWSMYHAFLY